SSNYSDTNVNNPDLDLSVDTTQSTITHSRADLHGILFNARSLRSKLPNLLAYLAINTYNFICITETWLSSECDSSELIFPSDYIVYRKDRELEEVASFQHFLRIYIPHVSLRSNWTIYNFCGWTFLTRLIMKDAVSFHLKRFKLPKKPKIIRSLLNYKQGDFEQLNTLLHVSPWDMVVNDHDVESSWNGFLDLRSAAVRDSIPTKMTHNRGKSPWINGDLAKLLKKKRRLFKNTKQSNSVDHWNTYKTFRNLVQSKVNKAYWAYSNDILSNSDNFKRFWSFVRSRRPDIPLDYYQTRHR
ncbi:uncharacterized protein, partial [Apostichopus japonicus]|uniref:uncharacterized protein n=1 Tax=Stichopus japonicus TaxID=307972 RepID=UPI003AB3399B